MTCGNFNDNHTYLSLRELASPRQEPGERIRDTSKPETHRLLSGTEWNRSFPPSGKTLLSRGLGDEFSGKCAFAKKLGNKGTQTRSLLLPLVSQHFT